MSYHRHILNSISHCTYGSFDEIQQITRCTASDQMISVTHCRSIAAGAAILQNIASMRASTADCYLIRLYINRVLFNDVQKFLSLSITRLHKTLCIKQARKGIEKMGEDQS